MVRDYHDQPPRREDGVCSTHTSFTYDEDGNLKQDGTFDYAWDGENRLKEIVSRIDLGTSSSNYENGDKKVEFKYDYMDRRVEKKVYTYNGGWGSATEIVRFVYHGLNVVMVLDDSNNISRKYTWGLDLSGQSSNVIGIHSAGGVGGLLAVEETATSGSPTYWFFYDANGNVAQIIHNTTGYATVSKYEYDSFGNTISSTGSYATDNPFRFSTKWSDNDFGSTACFYYYGYRYYVPRIGRWLNRDPIWQYMFLQESGRYGLPEDLYTFGRNQANLGVDTDGRLFWIVIGAVILTWDLWPDYANAPAPGDPIHNGSPGPSGASAIGAGIIAAQIIPHILPHLPDAFEKPSESPGPGWEWRGKGAPGSPEGSWYNPNTGESLHPDLGHPQPIGPHYDYRDPDGNDWRVFPDGRMEPKCKS